MDPRKDPRVDPGKGKGDGGWSYGLNCKMVSALHRQTFKIDKDGFCTAFQETLAKF